MLKLVKPTKIRMLVGIALVTGVLLVVVIMYTGVFDSNDADVYGPGSLPDYSWLEDYETGYRGEGPIGVEEYPQTWESYPQRVGKYTY